MKGGGDSGRIVASRKLAEIYRSFSSFTAAFLPPTDGYVGILAFGCAIGWTNHRSWAGEVWHNPFGIWIGFLKTIIFLLFYLNDLNFLFCPNLAKLQVLQRSLST